MMTSGEVRKNREVRNDADRMQAVKYKSSFGAAKQIIAKNGAKALFNGAGANILRGVASAGVLSIYDLVQRLFGASLK